MTARRGSMNGLSPPRPRWPQSLGDLPRHHDLRQRRRPGGGDAHGERRVRCRRELLRHRQLLRRRHVGDDAGRGAEGPAARTPSSPPRCSTRWAVGPTIRACRGCTSSSRSRPACSGCRPTTSTSTTSITSTSRRRSRRCCAPSTTSCARARSSTPACSNYEAWRLMEALWLSQTRNGWARFAGLPAAIQPGGARHRRGDRAGLRSQGAGRRRLVAARRRAISPASTSRAASRPQGTRSAEGWGFQSRFFAPNHAEILQALLDTARDINRSPAQTALRWVMDQPFMTSAIVGARNAAAARRDAGGRRLAPAGRGAGEARTRCPPSRTAIRAPSRSRWPTAAIRRSKCRR